MHHFTALVFSSTEYLTGTMKRIETQVWHASETFNMVGYYTTDETKV